jgi:hypothetical protein
MDHIVYLDAKTGEIENLIRGNKTMIIRGASGRKLPHGRVSQGDMLYFVNNNGDGEIRARGIAATVFCSGILTEEESFEITIRNQDKLQLPDNQFEKIAGKRFLVLIGIVNVERLTPFRFQRNGFTNSDDWLPVGKIDEYILSGHGIISAR